MKLTILLIEHIQVLDRQRKVFDEGKIIDLAESIKDQELIHAPAVQQNSLRLVAGERRLRAIELLHRRGDEVRYQGEVIPPGRTPVTLVAAESDIDLKEIELAENLRRVNLTWQEEAKAKADLHALRLEKTGGAQTLTMTAAEIKGAAVAPQEVSRLQEDIFLANALSDPEVAKIRDKKDAMRVAKEKAMAEKRKQFAETHMANGENIKSPHMLLHGDAVECLHQQAGIDLILTDPPYGMDAGDFGSQFRIAHAYEDSSDDWGRLMRNFAKASFAATKAQSHAFVFCHINKWEDLFVFFTDEGWTVWPRPLIWDKGSLGSLSRPQHGPRFCYEAIMFATKGEKKVLRTGRDVITIANTSKTHHAAEKPVDLYRELIGRCVEPGGLICDPFCGSGTIFPAATGMAVRAIGIEKDPTHHATALMRLGEGK